MKRILYRTPLLAILLAMCVSCENAPYQPIENALYIGNVLDAGLAETVAVEGTVDRFLTVRCARNTDSDVEFRINVDESFLAEYNQRYGTDYKLLSRTFYDIDSYIGTIPQGKLSYSTGVSLYELSQELKDTGLKYALPITITNSEGGPDIIETARHFLYVVTMVPYANVPEFGSSCFPQLLLAEDMVADVMTFECLINYASNVTSTGNKATPLALWNKAEGSGSTLGSGVYIRLGDASQPGNLFNGSLKDQRYDFPSSAALSLRKWHHLAVVIDGASSYWYLDGTKVLEVDVNQQFGLIADKNKIFLTRNGPALGLAGTEKLRYSEVRLWNVARTAKQVQNNMYGVDPQTPGLMGYWKFNEGQGNVYKDATGKNPDAVHLGSDPTWYPRQRVEIGQ